MAHTSTVVVLGCLTGGLLAVLYFIGTSPAYMSPAALLFDIFFQHYTGYPPGVRPVTQSAPPAHPIRFTLQQILYHGPDGASDRLLQQPIGASQLQPTVESGQASASEFHLRAVPAQPVTYPIGHVEEFQRYLVRQHRLPSAALDASSIATAAANLSLSNVPFRYHYHLYTARPTTSYWRYPTSKTEVADSLASTSPKNWHHLPPLIQPDVADKETVRTIAKMAANAYMLPADDVWFDLRENRWVHNDSFGWGSDGLRGHVFADDTNSTVVIALKGTSTRFFLGGDSETAPRDKLNDNRLFSCCCGRVDYTWSTVCDCFQGGRKCGQQCVEDSLDQDDLYFQAAINLFEYVHGQYPRANLWLTGHSLGGSLAALMGITYGHPVVTFEAPPERLAAQRLHLPVGGAIDMDSLPVWHFGHNADPIFMGTCNGATSSCYYGGYAMESKCHTGHRCTFDVVKDKAWRADIRHHRIKRVIKDVLADANVTWPLCQTVSNCTDCTAWAFV
ncbi:putative lipase atg15 [Tieghemiomyces parasiticus]|uniref:triacylglycerol lipase n=1 Tax=Tieghemiomyces parasiticus TaxID=78921 RepID=A0A9W8A710_9FUNG|nr:putative lipase atg15 [Tieghemiomyces parasiticus]